MEKTITINILDYSYIDTDKYHTTYHISEDQEKRILTDLLEIHFIELPKFLEQSPDYKNSLHRWLIFLKDPRKETLEVLKMYDPAIEKAYQALEDLSQDPKTLRLAELRLKYILDERSGIEGAREEGMNEGIKEVAKKMLLKGMDEALVMEISGLTLEEIRNIDK